MAYRATNLAYKNSRPFCYLEDCRAAGVRKCRPEDSQKSRLERGCRQDPKCAPAEEASWLRTVHFSGSQKRFERIGLPHLFPAAVFLAGMEWVRPLSGL